MITNENIEKSIEFATQCHKGQKRLGGEPYITHPVAVAELLQNTFKDATDELLQVAILHDVIEDTGATEQMLQELFGGVVAHNVMLVSKFYIDGKCDYEQYLEGIKTSPIAIKVKLADRIHNISKPLTLRGKEWNLKYIESSKNILKQLGGYEPKLAKLLKKEIDDYIDFVNNNF